MTSNLSDIPLEYEIKLEVSPAELARLRRLPIISELASGRGRTQRLKTIYYDTPGNALMGRRVGLRIRVSGKRYIQCLKAPADEGLSGLARKEWEIDIGGERLQLELFLDSDAITHLVNIDADSLVPRFETLISRRVRMLKCQSGAVIELAIDEGKISALGAGAETSEPVCEVELELKSGSPKALYELAFSIHQEIPVHISHRTKAERGYRLLDPSLIHIPRASAIVMDSRVTVESALREIMRSCYTHWTQSEAMVLDSENTEGIHQLRVGLRRMHSALRLFKPLLPDDEVSHIRKELKWLVTQAGQARDIDVFQTERLEPIIKKLKHDDGLLLLYQHIEQQRRQAYDDLRSVLRSHRYTQFLLRAGLWIEGFGWREQPLDETTAMLFSPLRPLADTWLEDLYMRTLKIGKRFRNMSVKDRHRLRISIKRLRYATEFFSSLYGSKSKNFVGRLKTLQDQLGQLNDIAVTKQFLADRVLTDTQKSMNDGYELYKAAGVVIGWQSHDAGTIEGEVRKSWGKFLKARPFWNIKT